ncbi:MAG: signal peptide peptidase SppA [Pseudomonadota bacterium]
MENKSLLSRTLSALWGGLDSIRKVLHLVLLLIIFFGFVAAMSSSSGGLPDKAALLIQPAGSLVEQLDGDPFDLAVSEILGNASQQTLVQDVIEALQLARDDDRITAVHLEVSGLGSASLSKLQRVAAAIEEFKTSGKPVIASADFFTQAGYFLAAHADEVYMHPKGVVFLQGFGSYRTYYKELIDTVQVDWNVFRVGTHKSFVEPYTRMGMSPEDRESRTRLVNRLWTIYHQEVDTARDFEPGTTDSFAQDFVAKVEGAGGDLAEAALQAGLVDGLIGRAELRDLLKTHAGESSQDNTTYSSVGASSYLAERRLLGDDGRRDENVAVIVAVGSILDGSQAPGSIGGDSTAALLRRALEDESVKAVVLRVDSGGGSVFASEVIAHEVNALREAGKPVIASMSSVAASGGYWISVVADKVIANPSTITGSIGVFAMFPTYHRSLDVVGMATDGVGTTPWAGQLRPDREMSESMKQVLQLSVNDIYDDFISNVAELRGMEKDAVDRVAQGQVWIAEDALAHGLIDELGDYEYAVAAAAELAGLESDEYGVFEIATEPSPTEQMILDLLATAESVGLDPAAFVRPPSSLDVFATRVDEALSRIAQFNDPMHTYSHCFCEIN